MKHVERGGHASLGIARPPGKYKPECNLQANTAQGLIDWELPETVLKQ
jgi:hypothetical protein